MLFDFTISYINCLQFSSEMSVQIIKGSQIKNILLILTYQNLNEKCDSNRSAFTLHNFFAVFRSINIIVCKKIASRAF